MRGMNSTNHQLILETKCEINVKKQNNTRQVFQVPVKTQDKGDSALAGLRRVTGRITALQTTIADAATNSSFPPTQAMTILCLYIYQNIYISIYIYRASQESQSYLTKGFHTPCTLRLCEMIWPAPRRRDLRPHWLRRW